MLILLLITRIYSETTTFSKDCEINPSNKTCDGKNPIR